MPTQTFPPLDGTRSGIEPWLSNGGSGVQAATVSLFFLPQSGEVLVNVKEHSRQINDIQLSRDMTMFVTASKDNTAKVSLPKQSGRAAAGPLHSSQLAQLPPRKHLLQINFLLPSLL